MNVRCGVILLSGFLGSGKTTLLRHLLETAPPAYRIVVLVNEFGKTGIDGEVVRTGDLEVIEINRGSIFCACAKGDFLRALYSIRRDLQPDLLLVEASGIADTRDIEKDLLRGGMADGFQLVENICVADAQRLLDWADLFNAVPRQIESASLLVLNKTDLAGDETLQQVEDMLRSLNPAARIEKTTYGSLPWSVLQKQIDAFEERKKTAKALPGPEAWEAFIDGVLDDEEAHLVPLDNMLSMAIRWSGPAVNFRKLLEELPGDVVRAKGYFVDENARWTIFDVVHGGEATFRPLGRERESLRNTAVFIRTAFNPQEIESLFRKHGLEILDCLL